MVGKTREERKVAAVMRARLSLRHALERIDYAEDVIKPQLLEMRQQAALNNVEVQVSENDIVDQPAIGA